MSVVDCLLCLLCLRNTEFLLRVAEQFLRNTEFYTHMGEAFLRNTEFSGQVAGCASGRHDSGVN